MSFFDHLCKGLTAFQDLVYPVHVQPYGILFICLAGSLGNIINIIVFGDTSMKALPINVVLQWLSITSFALLAGSITEPILQIFIQPLYSSATELNRFYSFALFDLLFTYYINVFHTVLICLTVLLVYCRCATIFKSLLPCDSVFIKRMIVFIYALNAIVGGLVFLYKKITVVQDSFTEAVYYVVGRADEDDFVILCEKTYIGYRFLLKIVASILFTGAASMLIYLMGRWKKNNVTILQDKESHVNRLSGMILALLILFLITEVPVAFYELQILLEYETDAYLNNCYTDLAPFLVLMILVYASFGTLCYLLFSHQYRTTLSSLIFRKHEKRVRSTHCRSEDSINQKSCKISDFIKKMQENVDMSNILNQNHDEPLPTSNYNGQHPMSQIRLQKRR